MTVEIRTNPPTAQLRLYDTFNYTLSIDPFGEHAADAKRGDKIMKSLPQPDLSPNAPPDAGERYQAKLDAFNRKHMSAVSVFISGLNEVDLHDRMQDFAARVAANQDVSGYFKGTRFAGKAKGSMNSVTAYLLKSALPQGIEAKIGVLGRWEVQDLVRYAVTIREALAARGIEQVQSGYTGAKSGLLGGFGIFKVNG